MIHGQIASSGTSGGAEGEFRFAGAGRTCLRCPPATHWAAEPTRDSAPRAPIAGSQSSKRRASRVGAWMT